MQKILHFLTIIFVITVLLFSGVSAAQYEDTLRVGIYYGNAAVKEVTFSNPDGFCAGIFTAERKFLPVALIESTSVKAEPDITEGTPSYHVSYSSYISPQEAQKALSEIIESGIDAFLGYKDGLYHILSGNYQNNNDALWAAENLAVKGTPVLVSSKSIRLKDSTGKTVFIVDDASYGLTVYSQNYDDPDSIITISESAKGTYRGGFEVKTLSDNLLTVVNTVPVESYLYSVVCREMSPSWEVEALKVQAVCARNFALGRINYHKQYGFDVCRTVCCQAYSTAADNSENVHKAVDETRGELLFYEDDLVQAVYSSSMGAHTENVKNVWGSSFPYLVSVENPYEDTENIYNGKWTKTLTAARASEIMKARGNDVGTVTDISIVETTPVGGVLKLKVTGTSGSKVFERESCRTVFSEATYSQRYTVTKGGQSIYPSVYVTDGNTTSEQKNDKLSVLSGKDKVSSAIKNLTAYDGKIKKLYESTVTAGSANTFIFSGEGWGHGVGMSQYGAKGMAENGFDYEEILTHYYTGTHLEKAY